MNTTLRLVKMAKKHYPPIIIATLGLTGAALLNLVTPETVRTLTSSISDGTLDTATLVKLVTLLIGAYLLRVLCRFASMSQAHVAAWNFVGELTLKCYDKLQSLSMSYYSDKQTGALMSRMVNDTRLLEVLIAHALPDLFSNVLVILSVAVMIFRINPLLALITLIPVPLVFAASAIFSKKIAPMFKLNQHVLGELNGTLADHLSGMKEIQAFGREDFEHKKISGDCAHYSHVNIRANYANAVFHPTVEFITSLGTVAVMGIGGVFAMRGTMAVSDIVGFFMYLSLFYTPLSALARLVEDISTAYAGGSRVLELLDTESEVKDTENAGDIRSNDGNIEFDHVTFAYGKGAVVLDDVSFKVKTGEMVALVGPTGVGKTTIISLLERFYDPQSGEVRIDGENIKNVHLRSLRDKISIVMQDVFLFNGTIAENIAYGKEGATQEDIERAAKTACAHEFISEMSDGYDTLIGERGLKLSGGQKQRLAIARAVLRDTPIMILDEATSAVDTETEAKIQSAIENLAGTRTLIVIAHRLSTVRRADRIMVIDGGGIAECGSHEELIGRGGIYAKLCGSNIA